MKKYISGFLMCLVLMLCVNTYAADIYQKIEVIIFQDDFVVDGQMMQQDTILYDGEAYVPLRWILETFDISFNVDVESRTVYLNKNNNQVITPPTYNGSITSSISSSSELREYLANNYSSLDTSVGFCQFSFVITEKALVGGCDYNILLCLDDEFEYKFNKFNFEYLHLYKDKAKEELKLFMEKMAKDIISKMPNKTIQGAYSANYCKLASRTVGVVPVLHCSWKNYMVDKVPSGTSLRAADFQWGSVDEETGW